MSQQFKGQYVEVIEVNKAWAIGTTKCRTVLCYTNTREDAIRAATHFEFTFGFAANHCNCRYTWE